MRVGIVTPRYPPTVEGGGETSVRLLAEQLEESDDIDDIAVFSFDGSETTYRNGVEVNRICNLSSVVTEWQNLRAYPHLRPYTTNRDILHAYNMELHPAVGAISAFHHVPAVATLNSYHFLPKSVSNATPSTLERLYELVGLPTTGRLLSHYIRRIDRFIAISSAVRDVYGEHGLDRNRIEIIPNMYDPSFAVSGRTRTNEPEITILYVGELVKRKGVSDLVRAMTKLSPEYHLRIVGDGPLSNHLEHLVTDLNISDQVTFTGFIEYDEIPLEYGRADVFVHPGVWPEPFGRTVLEAMQAGLPVVCTNVGGPADVVQQPELKCPPGDPQALSEAIETAKNGAAEIGEENQRYIANEYSPASVATKTISLYERILS